MLFTRSIGRGSILQEISISWFFLFALCHEMIVQVKDNLACGRAVVDYEPESSGVSTEFPSDELHSLVQLQYRVGRSLHQICIVLLRAYQKMCRCARKVIVEDNYIIVFVKHVRFFSAVNNIAENTFHLVAPADRV